MTVKSGVGAGLTTRTNSSGIYELYGVAGPVKILASKDGYPDEMREIDVAARSSLTIALGNGSSGCWDY